MGNFSDKLNVTGQLRICVIDVETDNVLCIIDHPNLVVALGRQNYSRLLGGDAAGHPVTKFAVGTNDTSPTMGDTAITGTFTKVIDSVAYPENDVQFSFILEGADSNGITIREFGLLTSADILFARTTPAPIIKTSAIRVEGTWTIKF